MLAKELEARDSPVRLVRAPDHDRRFDFVLVGKDTDAVLVDGVPNFASKALGLGGQMKTSAGLSSETEIQYMKASQMSEQYGEGLFIHYDYDLDRFILAETGRKFAKDMARKSAQRKKRSDVASDNRHSTDDDKQLPFQQLTMLGRGGETF